MDANRRAAFGGVGGEAFIGTFGRKISIAEGAESFNSVAV
jgi:hypothetical protein